MKVLVLTLHYWPEPFRISDFAECLQKSECDVTVLTGQPNYPEGKIYKGYSLFNCSKEIHNGIRIFRVPLIPRGSGSSLRLVLNYLSFILSASIVGVWKLRNFKFDYILVYGTSPILQALPALLLGKIKSAKIIIWVQDLWPESLEATNHIHNKTILSIVRRLVAWIYKNSTLLLAQSQAFIPEIKKLSGEKSVVFLPQPSESIELAEKSTPSGLKLGCGFNIVFAGNLGIAQSLDTILDAAKLLRDYSDIKFFLIGSGTEAQRIAQRIRDEAINNVEMPGRFSPDQIFDIYSQATALLVTLRDHDVFNKTIPGKIQTYLAHGKPIIGAINGEGARVVTDSRSGLVCLAEDPVALSRVILDLKNKEPFELLQMGNFAQLYYQDNFEIRNLVKKLTLIFEDLK